MINLLQVTNNLQISQSYANKDATLATIYAVVLAIMMVVIVVVGVVLFINCQKRQELFDTKLYADPLKALKNLDKRCEFCGAELEDNAKICPNCGAKLKNNKHKKQG